MPTRTVGPMRSPVDPLDARVEPAPVEAVHPAGEPGHGWLIGRISPPPPRTPVPVDQADQLITGQRVVWQSPKGWHFDIRAVSEPYEVAGRLMVDIAPEADWYLTQAEGGRPPRLAAYAHTVFLERPRP